jgi:hypothetical protein
VTAATAPAASAAPVAGAPIGALRPRRPWSARRNAAAITALAALCLAGPVLYEEVYIRTGHRAHRWRLRITDTLADHTLNNGWVIAAAAVGCVLGLWLLVLAATPGLRGLLTMSASGTSGVRAALDRRAAAAMLHRATLEVPGVSGAKVRVGRRRAAIRAWVRFGAHQEAREALVTVLSAERDRLGLVRPPTVRVRVRGGR